jgi:hypothetical protein
MRQREHARFETFVRNIADLPEGRATFLVLRDLAPGRRKYFAQNVVAVVARADHPQDDFHPLIVRSMVGNPYPGQWWVKVLESLPQRVPGTPYSNAFEAMERAWAKTWRDGDL